MGSGNAKLAQVTPADSTDSLAPVCDPCVNKNEPARGWCDQCGVYLCTRCVSTHNRSHKLAMGRNLPPTRPTPDSLLNNVEIKTVLPVATLEDNDLKREDVPYEERNIRGCVCIGEYNRHHNNDTDYPL
ncbi:hypothetical protein DPMN_052652 [Dreissena polymorpha]|uniref:B box-type domain-containing protein n=1 Tax=Dreissena polymorpha TaxID=45954 RepID=A0A9D4CK22_DREPO|nr:hypothetical protein DPMN_052652 [Dreissena polymorpha]